MIENKQSCFIMNQLSGLSMNVTHNSKYGIVYTVVNQNESLKYGVLEKNAEKNYSVVLMPEDELGVIYEDVSGNIFFSIHNKAGVKKRFIYKKRQGEELSFHLSSSGINNLIHIFYTIYSKNKNEAIIYHKTVDLSLNPVSVSEVDKFTSHNPLLNIYNSKQGKIYMVYQKQMKNWILGYKILNLEENKWSDYNIIDSSSLPFKDYSAIANKKFYSMTYIKSKEDCDYVLYYEETSREQKKQQLFSGAGIISCSIFRSDYALWCLWIKENILYSSILIVGTDNFSNPPYEEQIDTINTIKANYLTNCNINIDDIVINELYVDGSNKYKRNGIYDLFMLFEANRTIKSMLKYYTEELYRNLDEYKKLAIDKDALILQLNNSIETYRIKLLEYKGIFKEISERQNRFLAYKEDLKEGISLLEQDINAREKEIIYLKQLIEEKDEEISVLKALKK